MQIQTKKQKDVRCGRSWGSCPGNRLMVQEDSLVKGIERGVHCDLCCKPPLGFRLHGLFLATAEARKRSKLPKQVHCFIRPSVMGRQIQKCDAYMNLVCGFEFGP